MCKRCDTARASLRAFIPALTQSPFKGLQLFGKVMTLVTDSQHAVQHGKVDEDVAWEQLKANLTRTIVDNPDQEAVLELASLMSDMSDVVGLCEQGVAQWDQQREKARSLTILMVNTMGGGQSPHVN